MALIPCPGCGGTISDRAKNCPHCGLDLTQPAPEAEKRCVECGELLPAGAQACPTCGCPVEDEPAPAAQPAAPVTEPVAAPEPALGSFSFYEAPAEPAPAPVRETGFTEPTLLVSGPAEAPAPAMDPAPEAPDADAAPDPAPTPAPVANPAPAARPAPDPAPVPTDRTPAPARPANSLVPPDAVFLEMPRPNPKWKGPRRLELVVSDNKRIPVECSKVYKVATPNATVYALEDVGSRTINRILQAALGVLLLSAALDGLLDILYMHSYIDDLYFVLPFLILVSVVLLIGGALLHLPKDQLLLPKWLHFLLKKHAWLPSLLLILALSLALAVVPAFFTWSDLEYVYIPYAVIAFVVLLPVNIVRAICFKTRIAHFPVIPGHRFRLYWAVGNKLDCEQLID